MLTPAGRDHSLIQPAFRVPLSHVLQASENVNSRDESGCGGLGLQKVEVQTLSTQRLGCPQILLRVSPPDSTVLKTCV